MRHLIVAAILGAGCLVPGCGGPPPTLNVSYSPTPLKYLLLDHYGESKFFFCDPDYYPIAHGDETEKAVTIFPEIQSETEVFSAIIARKGFKPPFSNETKLVIYREYKMLRAIPLTPATGSTYSFSLQIGTMGEGRRISGIIRTDGVILQEQSEQAILTCPICLAGGTIIDTPAGPVRIEEMHAGMLVWSPGSDGVRRAVPVQRTIKTSVPPSHRLVHLVLSDGRELFASPGHPLMDGRPVGTLTIGDEVDGAQVIRADSVPDTGKYTYDILPEGDTGIYFANGIPLGSTLFQR